MADSAPVLGEGSVPNTTLLNLGIAIIGAQTLTPEEREVIAALPPASALLLIRQGGYAGARFLLDKPLTIAGRHPNADILLDDVTVSRKHVEFRRKENDTFVVTDLGSLNGTFINGERVDSAELTDGSEVQIGKFHLTFFTSKSRSEGLG